MDRFPSNPSVDLEQEIETALLRFNFDRETYTGRLPEQIEAELNKARETAIKSYQSLFLALLQSEICFDDLNHFGFLGVSGHLSLSESFATFLYKDVAVKVYWGLRVGDCWRVVVEGERDRHCAKGELFQTLLNAFAQIQLNERFHIEPTPEETHEH